MQEKVNPRILPGFMELLPADQILFNDMYDKIRGVYESFGFLPLDTPIIELSEVLLAKAGGETEKQIYRFNKGDNDLSLRFDLTVPLARYVAAHYNDLTFPFKRYQMSKVFRGERPQKGRFREFYQCDIDIIGNDELSILYDAEMPAVIYHVFKKLGIGGRFKAMGGPMVAMRPIMIPMKIVSDIAIPISLACRLFGNMLGGMIVMELLKGALGGYAAGIPGIAGLYFNLFHPLIQAYIFITLSLTFIDEAMEGLEE
jgi:hypothetical protein